MKQRLLVVLAVMAVSAAGWAMWVSACDQDKQTTAQAANGKSGRVTAVVAGAEKGNCTAEMEAQCKAHGMKASTASMAGCPYHSSATTASNAGHDGCAMKSSATTAGMTCEGHGVSATTASNGGHDGCATKSSATAAGMNCAGHGASATTASRAGHDCCAAKGVKASATTAMNSACDARSMGAGMIGAPDCGVHGTSAMTADMEGECDACGEMMTCSGQLTMNGVQTQAVPLKNGVMFVYTTDTPSHVRGVQNALARRNDRLNVLAQAGDHAKLCPACRAARGAIASGKLTRETVNIEGGCMTLVTSSDAGTIAKLRAMATMSNARVKS